MKNKGSVLITVLLTLAVILLPVLIYVYLSMHYHDLAADSENNIEKLDKAVLSSLSTYTLTMRDKMQIQDVHLESFKEAVTAQMSGRYGDSGAQGLMLWITENNMPYDSAIVVEMASYVTAGRTEIRLAQDRKTDYCTNYDKLRDRKWSGWWIEHEGFPKKDMDKLCRLLLDSDTMQSSETGIVESIDFKRKTN